MASESQELSDPLDTMISDQMLSTLYGQCVGDAIGLLTEFMPKKEARKTYGRKPKMLLYSQKAKDFHRSRWEDGDWTDDSDHAFLIIQSLLYNKGKVEITDFASRLHRWMRTGFPELGDLGGMGIGKTTSTTLRHPQFKTKPHEAAYVVWDENQRKLAPNGAVMRTSVLGIHESQDLDAVVRNTLDICKCTHHDPRCQASTVAVSVAIALMLQHTSSEAAAGRTKRPKPVNVSTVIKMAHDTACQVLTSDEEKRELWDYMSCTKVKKLQLDEAFKIGYTYKCMGAGFWALKQDNFQKAIIKLLMQGGDADTNCAVAGALLACKLGHSAIPQPWLEGLLHREWMTDYFNRFLRLQKEMSLPMDKRSSHNDLDLQVLIASDVERQGEIEKRRRDKFLEQLEENDKED